MSKLLLTAPLGDPVEPVLLMVVGRVSADKAYLATHGTFSPAFGEPILAVRGAKLQFTLECPVGDPDFEEDFILAATRLSDAQTQIASTPRHKYFLQESNTGMRLNFPLWEKTVSPRFLYAH